ncbi:MAG: PepSY-like domain-containing protein [Bacteroidota bacterium]
MKTIKIIMLVMLAGLFSMSCEKDDNTTGETETSKKSVMFSNSSSDYPDGIDSYISANYPGAVVDEVYLRQFSDGSVYYEVELTNDVELYFDGDGNYLGMDDDGDDISPESLPQAILDYLSNNYPDETIVQSEIDMENGQMVYEVYLSNGMELYFNQSGSFISSDDDSEYILESELPQSILDYISSNHPDATIVYAELDYDDGQMEYEVKLDNGMELEFDGNGNLTSSEDNHIAIADLPQAIIDYVDQNYPDRTIVKAELEYEDGQQMYEVELDNEMELYFDLDGNFLFSEED